MKQIFLHTILFFLFAFSVLAQDKISIENPQALAWLKQRFQEAQKQQSTKIKIPLARRGQNWGCTCPEYFISPMSYGNITDIWIKPIFQNQLQAWPRDGVIIAEGYLTGKTIVEKIPFNAAEPGGDSKEFSLLEFQIEKIEPFDGEQSANPDYIGLFLMILR